MQLPYSYAYASELPPVLTILNFSNLLIELEIISECSVICVWWASSKQFKFIVLKISGIRAKKLCMFRISDWATVLSDQK